MLHLFLGLDQLKFKCVIFYSLAQDKNKLWDVLISEMSRCSLVRARFSTISRFMWSHTNSFLAVAFCVKYRQECYWSPQPHQTLSVRLITSFQILLSRHYKVTRQRRSYTERRSTPLFLFMRIAYCYLYSKNNKPYTKTVMCLESMSDGSNWTSLPHYVWVYAFVMLLCWCCNTCEMFLRLIKNDV